MMMRPLSIQHLLLISVSACVCGDYLIDKDFHIPTMPEGSQTVSMGELCFGLSCRTGSDPDLISNLRCTMPSTSMYSNHRPRNQLNHLKYLKVQIKNYLYCIPISLLKFVCIFGAFHKNYAFR